jgi:hypothetical protein
MGEILCSLKSAARSTELCNRSKSSDLTCLHEGYLQNNSHHVYIPCKLCGNNTVKYSKEWKIKVSLFSKCALGKKYQKNIRVNFCVFPVYGDLWTSV